MAPEDKIELKIFYVDLRVFWILSPKEEEAYSTSASMTSSSSGLA